MNFNRLSSSSSSASSSTEDLDGFCFYDDKYNADCEFKKFTTQTKEGDDMQHYTTKSNNDSNSNRNICF